MNIFFPVVILVMAVAATALLIRQNKGPIIVSPSPSSNVIRYVAMGDSHTIGEGVKESERWPNILSRHFNNDNKPVMIVANIARTGWTTQNLIDLGLPLYDTADPDFATLQIGVNDWVQKIETETFRSNFRMILERMLAQLSGPDKLVVVNIPDFGVTPTGKAYAGGRDISQGIAAFNAVIQEESTIKEVRVADVFAVSKGMGSNPSLISWDGLHPAAQEYVMWEQAIYPVAAESLK